MRGNPTSFVVARRFLPWQSLRSLAMTESGNIHDNGSDLRIEQGDDAISLKTNWYKVPVINTRSYVLLYKICFFFLKGL